MGKTVKSYKGKEHTPKERKKWKDKKHFGETNGSHSRRDDGKNPIKGTRRVDETNIKGKDFVKYGYPFDMRSGKAIKNLQDERDADEQLKNL